MIPRVPAKTVRNVCPACGSDALDLGPGKGPHPASVVCSHCHKFVRWCGLPIDREEASKFIMPYGKHEGMSMDQLPRDYLAWLAGNVKGRIAERARVLLAEGGKA